jgi:CubicO group peptidase (beta-lactamase class C family)
MKLRTDMPAESLIKGLGSLIPKKMEDANVPGLSLALIRDADLLWSRGFGVKSTGSGEPVEADTVFSAQSLSKPVFAYAALKMCERGVLDLDVPLTEYLPEPYLPDDPHIGLVTARHVLSHTTGLPNWRPRGKPLKVLFNPGERFSYSGEGFVYLGRVVEHLSRKPLAEYMKENLLEPFGMHNSSYVWIDEFEGAAEAHDKEGKPFGKKKAEEANPAASLCSTAPDYAKFVCEVIQPRRVDGYRLSEETVGEMLRPQIGVYYSISWGLGWGIQHSKNGDTFWQWGKGSVNQGGFQAFAMASKEHRAGVVIMTNSANGLRICEDIVTQSLGGEHPAFSDFLGI